MKALKLIIQREYVTRVKKKSFIVLTILMPFLIAVIIVGPLLLAKISDGKEKKIVIIDETGRYAQHLKSIDEYRFETTTDNIDRARYEIGDETYALLHITDNLATAPKAATFYSEKQAPKELLFYINNTLNTLTKNSKLESFTLKSNIDKETIASIQDIIESNDKIEVNTIKWNEDGIEKETSASIASGIGIALTMFMYMFILTYGSIVMQGVIEEKSNRIVEVMISSVKPFDLMMGKIIGIGLTGLTQFGIWISIAFVLFITNENILGMTGQGNISMIINQLPTINWGEILLYFFLFFVGGYMIYASLFAMFASAVDNPQDSQQFVMPITLIFLFALYASIYSIENPDGPLAFWCSMIPLTSPIVMMIRIPFEIPMWEKITSITILYISVFLAVKFAGKIYRVGILMYGKKPNIKELYKWMKYK